MAWNTSTSYTAASDWGATQANGVGLDLRTWGGAVDAAGYALSNLGVLTFHASGYINSNVGIGAVPSSLLHLQAASAPVLTFKLTGAVLNAKIGGIEFRNQFAGYTSGIESWASDLAYVDQQDLRFYTYSAAKVERMRITAAGVVTLYGTPVYADNAAAVAGGLTAGMQYRTATGTRMEVY